MYIHPRGWVYFRCDEYRLVVDEDIRVPETLERITSICKKENLALLSDGQELCIVGFNSYSALYLAVDHTQCTAEYGLEFSSVTQPIRDIPLSRDNLTQGTKSTVPFTKAECEELLRVLDVPHYSFRRAERYGVLTFQQTEINRRSTSRPHSVWQSSSRMSRNCLWILINGPLCGIPHSYLEHVQRAISTVLLSYRASNPLILSSQSYWNIYQMARVCAIMSAFASLGSITTGVFFVWRHQHNTKLSSSHTFAYIYNARKQILGLPGHSILLSLPAALLMWSLIGFMVALSAYSLQSVTDGSMADIATIIYFFFNVAMACWFITVRGGDKALKYGGGNAVKRNNEVNRTGGQGAPGCCLIYMRENPPGTDNGPLVTSWSGPALPWA
ncbi:predicted protein [Postia placenta Mad-698-R]|nr:predicted protein [Postia placenta Mad-698-R]